MMAPYAAATRSSVAASSPLTNVRADGRDVGDLRNVNVMWHIEPSRGIEVSVKSNPGQATHEACGDRGYTFVKPAWAGDDITEIRSGSRHEIAATIAGATLRVVADGRPAWVGELPAQAFQANGPVGVRSDNGVFDVELRASAAGAGPR